MNADMSDLCNDVIQAFDVLNIYGGIDIDPVAQQLFNVQIALRVTAAWCVGVDQLIDPNNLRTPGDDGIEVHLVEQLAFILDALAGNDFQALQQRLRFFATVGI